MLRELERRSREPDETGIPEKSSSILREERLVSDR